MSVMVFHLMVVCSGRKTDDIVLRYEYDPRCAVERGDVWDRTDSDGRVSYHRVENVRRFLGVSGEEVHVYMLPHAEVAA